MIVDITGGTKVMSAALALCARQWPCRYYYTGGTERGNNNVGIVVDGSEKEFETENPWDALGYQALEEFRLFFNANQFAAARLCAEEAKKRAGDEGIKKKFQAWETLASGYAAWESFDHATALTDLNSVAGKYANDMAANGDAIWGGEQKNLACENIEQLTQLSGSRGQPTAMMVFELLANAQRRGAEGRYDDAVARLYRCTEAIAQFRLLDRYKLDSGAVPLGKLPKSLQDKWSSRALDGMLKLALQDDYALLRELGDDLGRKFTELGMAGEKSPLSARNSSILAHGFIPISEKAYGRLLGCVQALAEALGGFEAGGINFPKIGGQGSTKPQSGN